MGWYLDGRVTAVVGTHTHVPTADARVLPGGTAYMTDVGMTGPRGGVIGVKQGAGDQVARRPDARALRDVRGRPVADGRAHPVRGSGGGPRRSSRCSASRGDEDASAASSSALRAATTTTTPSPRRDEVEVARRELDQRQRDAPAHSSAGRPELARPSASAANGASQITNCGESTLPSATNASSAAKRAAARGCAVVGGLRAASSDRAGERRGEQRRRRAPATSVGRPAVEAVGLEAVRAHRVPGDVRVAERATARVAGRRLDLHRALEVERDLLDVAVAERTAARRRRPRPRTRRAPRGRARRARRGASSHTQRDRHEQRREELRHRPQPEHREARRPAGRARTAAARRATIAAGSRS